MRLGLLRTSWVLVICGVITSCGVANPLLNVEHNMIQEDEMRVYMTENIVAGLTTESELEALARVHAANFLRKHPRYRYFYLKSQSQFKKYSHSICRIGLTNCVPLYADYFAFRYVFLESPDLETSGRTVFDAQKIKPSFWDN